ncbi:MAG TPA: phosphate regulon transcriptional regulator PhoB [Rhizomicrobium sp.]|nr:phosphate regulon transcriptional regulator PhoB [Rhizomicrobium sp.]
MGSDFDVLKPSVLLVDHDRASLALVSSHLEREGYRARASYDGEEALRLIEDDPPDILLLEWVLPKLSGLDVCRMLRSESETRKMPILMLTTRGEEADRLRGFEAGADDYIVKPFSVSELTARLRAVLKRVSPGLVEDVIRIGDLELDRAEHRVRRGGRKIHLGPTEFKLLSQLLQRPGRVYSREQLIESVWGAGIYVDSRTIDVHILRLRRALRVPGAECVIRTVRSAGYAFDSESV